MKLIIEIPKEFERDFNADKFRDFFERVKVDLENNTGVKLCGNYERETVDMLENAFENAKEMKKEDVLRDTILSIIDQYKFYYDIEYDLVNNKDFDFVKKAMEWYQDYFEDSVKEDEAKLNGFGIDSIYASISCAISDYEEEFLR